MTADDLAAGLYAAELAAAPLLDLIETAVDFLPLDGLMALSMFASLERSEVYQATGMIVGQLDVNPVDALLRLRAHAFAHGMTAMEVPY
jgi:hypothetical protein